MSATALLLSVWVGERTLMFEMPTIAVLLDQRSHANVAAHIVSLDEHTARRQIDDFWWASQHQITAPDRHWSWEWIAREAGKSPVERTCIGLERNGAIQGAVAFSIAGSSILEAQAGAIYAERLATAPWNRIGHVPRPLYRGVGQSLLQYTVLMSVQLGLAGRVALSSLAASEAFYRKLRFVRTREADDEGLPIYELPAAAAGLVLSDSRLTYE